ncbi:MAG: hypothetical protein AAF830_07555 [Pseudomonadota bacterium]
MIKALCAACLGAAAALSIASAEVVSSSDSGFQLSHSTTSDLTPDALFERMLKPATWWDGAHTFSGDASNLSMKAEAGAYWREDWDGGSVIHGQVMQVIDGQALMLSAPFGPLAPAGATCVWTMIIAEGEDGGSKLISTHTVSGLPGTGLAELAGAVDSVMVAGVERLVSGAY